MSSADVVGSQKSYSFKRHTKKTRNILEERWIKRIHYFHPRARRLPFAFDRRHRANAARLGIEPNGNHVDAPAKFHVETSAAGKGTVEVIVLNPKGQREKVSAQPLSRCNVNDLHCH